MSDARLAPQSYAFGAVLAAADITKSNLTHWAREGVIVPSVHGTTGTGKYRQFGFRNIFEARIASHLNRLGMSVSDIREVILRLALIDDSSIALVNGDEDLLERLLRLGEDGFAHAQTLFANREQHRNIARRWAAFKTPELRRRIFDYVGLSLDMSYDTVSDGLIMLPRSEGPESLLDPTYLPEVSVVVNLTSIITKVEIATGDTWPGVVASEVFARWGWRGAELQDDLETAG